MFTAVCSAAAHSRPAIHSCGMSASKGPDAGMILSVGLCLFSRFFFWSHTNIFKNQEWEYTLHCITTWLFSLKITAYLGYQRKSDFLRMQGGLSVVTKSRRNRHKNRACEDKRGARSFPYQRSWDTRREAWGLHFKVPARTVPIPQAGPRSLHQPDLQWRLRPPHLS